MLDVILEVEATPETTARAVPEDDQSPAPPGDEQGPNGIRRGLSEHKQGNEYRLEKGGETAEQGLHLQGPWATAC